MDFSGQQLRVRWLLLAMVSTSVAVSTACQERSDHRILLEMPVVAEAVVAPETGRLLPSASGNGHELWIPDEVFALSATLAEIRSSQMENDEAVRVTITSGDRVKVLLKDDDPLGVSLVRTQRGTYCWLPSSALKMKGPSAPSTAQAVIE